jgi:hypothetical protein
MVISTNSLLDCLLCGLSKLYKVISRKLQDVPNTYLGIVHVDIVGSISLMGRNGELYWMLITSGKTGQQWIFTADTRAALGVKLTD